MVLFTNVSNPTNTNVIVSEQDYVLMTVKACSDVYIHLTPRPGDYTESYEIRIGINGNSRTEFHRVGSSPQSVICQFTICTLNVH